MEREIRNAKGDAARAGVPPVAAMASTWRRKSAREVHSNAADVVDAIAVTDGRRRVSIARRSQKANDVKAEKEKMRPFEKARADLVKRNDKLDRDQAAKEQEMTKALEGQKKLKKRLEKAKAVRGRRPSMASTRRPRQGSGQRDHHS